MHIYATEEKRVAELVMFLFSDRNVLSTLIHGSPFLRLLLETNAKISSTLFHRWRLSTKSEAVLLSHGHLNFHAEFKKKAMTVTQDYKARSTLGIFIKSLCA